MNFSPLKLRNEGPNVHYCSWKSFLQRETWLNVIFILVTDVMSIVHLTVCQNHGMYLNDSIFRGAIIGTLHG